MSEREKVLLEIVMDYAVHDSWRCYSSYYPGECHCGLDDLMHKAGLKTWADVGVKERP